MSDVAQLKKRIENECSALELALHGYAVVSSHEAITQRYSRIGNYHEELKQLVGEYEATEIMCEAYNQILR